MRLSQPFASGRLAHTSFALLLPCAFVWTGLLILNLFFPPSIPRSSILFLGGPLCILWCALRFPLLEGSWQRQTGWNIAGGALLGLVFSGLALALNLLPHGGLAPGPHWKLTPPEAATLALALNESTFVIARPGKYLWFSWQHLRRKQLLWTFTNAHVTPFVLLVGLLAVLCMIVIFFTSRDLPLTVIIGLLFLVMSVCIFVTIVPLSVLFSYLMVRQMIPRLKALTEATGALRSGNYTMRVPVTGEDEIAQLQTDFNAMAGKLEYTVHTLEHTMQELQQERDTVAHLLQDRRELFANISHELRTPTATLRSYLEITLSHWNEKPSSVLHHHLQVMENEVVNLQTLVDDLFTLARAEVEMVAQQEISVDISILVVRIVMARAPLARQASKIEIMADVPSSVPAVQADPRRLEQILQNLLQNALRHTPPGGIIVVAITVDPEAVVVHVKDTGEGIAPQDLPHIWERFYQTESSLSLRGSGMGLGLALVKEWIEAMGGTIAVESVIGEGSCFTFRLPLTSSENRRTTQEY